jgi:hypothetical protein
MIKSSAIFLTFIYAEKDALAERLTIMKAKFNLLNKSYTWLTVMEQLPNRGTHRYWKCMCKCGNIIDVEQSHLIDGHTNSCGCYRRYMASKSNITHGMSGKNIYNVWVGMIERCGNIKSKNYNNYGGRGITVCSSWLIFDNFYKDMGDKPKGMSIDRIDNDGNYCKGNCRWATAKEQCNNRRSNHPLTCKNITKNLKEWELVTGIKWSTIKSRIDRLGWSTEKALTTPIRGAKRLTYNGESKTLFEWSKITGIKYTTLFGRFKNDSLTTEMILKV